MKVNERISTHYYRQHDQLSYITMCLFCNVCNICCMDDDKRYVKGMFSYLFMNFNTLQVKLIETPTQLSKSKKKKNQKEKPVYHLSLTESSITHIYYKHNNILQ
uniref:Uncharacterized protein n=1 Tax=Glossina brevipalpis TaxID=37001 RepID=A0A1A9X4J7_9MUSC